MDLEKTKPIKPSQPKVVCNLQVTPTPPNMALLDIPEVEWPKILGREN
jgi:hypothetical protein